MSKLVLHETGPQGDQQGEADRRQGGAGQMVGPRNRDRGRDVEHHEIAGEVEDDHCEEGPRPCDQVGSGVGDQGCEGGIDHEGSADHDERDQAADEAGEEGRRVDVRHVPDPGHGSLHRLSHALRTVDQSEEADGQTDAAAFETLRRVLGVELGPDDRKLVKRRDESVSQRGRSDETENGDDGEHERVDGDKAIPSECDHVLVRLVVSELLDDCVDESNSRGAALFAVEARKQPSEIAHRPIEPSRRIDLKQGRGQVKRAPETSRAGRTSSTRCGHPPEGPCRSQSTSHPPRERL